MAVRTEMTSLVGHCQRLVTDVASTTWTSDQVQQTLDAHRTDFDYLPLWHDSDYHLYAARQRSDTMRALAEANVSRLSPVIYDVPDFGRFYRVGYLALNWVIRNSPTETTAANSPDIVDTFWATFLFSTAPNAELYLKATGYNVWSAAADLLLETPDTGREYDTARVRGQVSRTIEQKWALYRQRGLRLNRRKRTLVMV